MLARIEPLQSVTCNQKSDVNLDEWFMTDSELNNCLRKIIGPASDSPLQMRLVDSLVWNMENVAVKALTKAVNTCRQNGLVVCPLNIPIEHDTSKYFESKRRDESFAKSIGSHWIVFVLRLIEGSMTVFFLDPLPTHRAHSAHYFCSLLAPIVVPLVKCRPPICVIEIEQETGHDCGPVCCFFVDLLINFKFSSVYNLQAVRKWLKNMNT
jgi:hypothetical protein